MGLMSWPTLNLPMKLANQVYVLGEGDRGAYGVGSGESVGVRMMIGVRLLGGVGGLLSRMTGETSSERISPPSCSLVRWPIGIGCCGMGAKILGGCCLSGMSLSGLVGVVVTVGAVWGASTCHSDL